MGRVGKLEECVLVKNSYYYNYYVGYWGMLKGFMVVVVSRLVVEFNGCSDKSV